MQSGGSFALARSCWSWALLLALSVGGCPPASRVKPEGVRPTLEELRNLTKTPVRLDLTRFGRAPAMAWDLQGPLPGTFGVVELRPPYAAWEETLRETAASRPGLVLLTEGMRCVAREVGRFLLTNKKLPDTDLEEFIAARCGESQTHFSYSSLTLDQCGAEEEEKLWSHLNPAAREAMGKSLQQGNLLAGSWLGRQGERAIWLLVAARREAQLQAAPAVPGPDQLVRLQGDLLGSQEKLQAVVTNGRFGTEVCLQDPAVALPRFSLACPVRSPGQIDRIEVVGFMAGRFLGQTLAEVEVWPPGDVPHRYQPVRYVPERLAGDVEEARQAVVELVNALRQEHALPPLVLQQQQSRLADDLIGVYYNAAWGEGETLDMDRVAIGMMSGLAVPGMVLHGTFLSRLRWGAPDAGALLSTVMHSPAQRKELLDRRADSLAVGVLHSNENGGVLAVLLSTYQLAGPDTPRLVREKVAAAIAQQRIARQLTPPRALEQVNDILDSAMGAMQAGRISTDALVQQVGQQVVDRLRRPVRTMYLELDDPDEVEVPPALLDAKDFELALSAAPLHRSGNLFGHFAVLLVLVESMRL